ncbi:MAG: lytic transglycosylase domain-containing protein, partial [Clostridia bacterium]|nr:lytic transglycosylase domain-containing protein [Clostridia bacterium]
MKKRKKRRFPLVPLAMLALLAALFVVVYPRLAARSQYPVRYEAEIRKAAEVYSLDPALLAAV